MSDTTTKPESTQYEDFDTTALFDEIEKEKRNDYETCSASQAFDAVFQCYSKLCRTYKVISAEKRAHKNALLFR